jgi:hypothetical protein
VRVALSCKIKNLPEDRKSMQQQETSVFSTTVQTASGANSAPCSMCTGFFLGVMRPGRDADHSPLSNADVKNGRNYTFAFLVRLHWNCGFKSRRGHEYLSVVSVVCCHVEVSATGRSPVQRSPTDCGISLCVIYKPQIMRRSWPTVCQKKINNKCLRDVDRHNFTLLPEERKVFRESFNSLRPLLKELNPQR